MDLHSQNTNIDTLYIKELITDKIFAKISVDESPKEFNFDVDSLTIGAITFNTGEDGYLIIITPDEKVSIIIDSMSIETQNDLADSLLNYLWKSNNEFIAENSKVIFTNDNPQLVISIFDNLMIKRANIIQKNKYALSSEEMGIINYQMRLGSIIFVLLWKTN